MKIAIATDDEQRVSGHAGQATHWLLYECAPDRDPGVAQQITLARDQVFHRWDDRGPHPLDGVELIVARSAGEGFLRRMQKRGALVLLTGEENADQAIRRVLAGDALPPPGWDASLLLCKLRDLFSKH